MVLAEAPLPDPHPADAIPVGASRVGCIGRRSPGRSGGRGGSGRRRTRTLKNWLSRHRASRRWPRSSRWRTACSRREGKGALYTGRGPVCGMIIRGGGAIGAVGLTGAEACICGLIRTGGGATGGGEALPAGADGMPTRGGTAMAGGGYRRRSRCGAAGAAGGGRSFGGITTTGAVERRPRLKPVSPIRCGLCRRRSVRRRLGRRCLWRHWDRGVSAFASTAGVAAGGLTTGRAAGCSTASFCCVIARSTSPGSEIWERSILVLMSSFAVGGTRSRLRTRRRVGAAAKMFPHQFRFVLFKRTGVRFLLRDAHRGQHVKNLFALDFQLTGQIVDSNLTHPLSFPLPPADLVSKSAYLTSRHHSVRASDFRSDEARASLVRRKLRTRHDPGFSSVYLPGLLQSRLSAGAWFGPASAASVAVSSEARRQRPTHPHLSSPSVSDSSLTAASVAASVLRLRLRPRPPPDWQNNY